MAVGEVPLTLVDCGPLKARLTEASCARRWRAAQDADPAPWDSLHHCKTCPLGAMRAGMSMSVASDAATIAAFHVVCPRCGRQSLRIIRGRWCVSCYNREREASAGRNAKGTAPRIASVIHAEALAVTASDAPRIMTVDRVVSRAEACAVAARQAGPGAIIGVPPLAALLPPGVTVTIPMMLPMGEPAHDLAAAPPPRSLIAGIRRRAARTIPLPRPTDRAYAAQPALPL